MNARRIEQGERLRVDAAGKMEPQAERPRDRVQRLRAAIVGEADRYIEERVAYLGSLK